MPSSAAPVSAPASSRSTARQAMPARRDGDQHDLDQRGQRLGLAVAEAMVVVGGQRRDAHPEERDQAGDEVERGVGEAAEHRHRAGRPRRPALEPEQEQTATATLASAARVAQRRALGLLCRGTRLTGRAGLRSSRRRRAVNSRRSWSRCGAVGPELDPLGDQPEAGPVRRARHVAALEPCAASPRSAPRRSRGGRAAATGPTPRRRAANRAPRLAK